MKIRAAWPQAAATHRPVRAENDDGDGPRRSHRGPYKGRCAKGRYGRLRAITMRWTWFVPS
ncbi:hypothetical protein SSPNP10_23745 [Streptomyces sp. NP10]|nr:hypothetical protein SSPNP10_23745 [Streptomyces sp. NP10]